MKRITVMLAITAVVAALATPAMAGKPDKPPKTPEYSYYTLDIASDALSTTCGDDVDINVRRDGSHFEWFYEPPPDDGSGPVLPLDIELRLAAPGLSWSGELISGCRNAGVVETYLLDGDIETGPANGYFRISLQDDGTVAMLWIFDIYERYEEVQLNRKRTRVEQTVPRTDFRMGGPYNGDYFAQGDWITDGEGVITGSAAGTFIFVRYDQGGDPMFVDLTNGIHEFAIEFTLTPIP